MNTLAFDTCYDACSAAVFRHGDKLSSRFEPMRTGHAERLMPMIAEVLDEAGLAAHDLDRIAVTRGPGTFTGTRIGIAAARALMLATGAEGLGFPSLMPIALQAARKRENPDQGDIMVVARPSRRGQHDYEIFAAPSGEPLCEPFLAEPDDILHRTRDLAAVEHPHIVIVGTGAEELQEAFVKLGHRNASIALPQQGFQFDEPDAAWLAAGARGLLDHLPVTPLYLRPADAKPSSKPPIPRITESPA